MVPPIHKSFFVKIIEKATFPGESSDIIQLIYNEHLSNLMYKLYDDWYICTPKFIQSKGRSCAIIEIVNTRMLIYQMTYLFNYDKQYLESLEDITEKAFSNYKNFKNFNTYEIPPESFGKDI